MDVIIVGDGLSGLYLAHLLAQERLTFKLVEARARLRGRALSLQLEENVVDVGPAWFWRHQQRIRQLLKQFDLESFEQYSDGDGLYQQRTGQIRREAGAASMADSLRPKDGIGKLIDKLAESLPEDVTVLSSSVMHVAKGHDGYIVTCKDYDGQEMQLTTKTIVYALPPRIIPRV
eukprot:TRINITY_DN12534_c2_g10_i1.p2 TRINITY_DN12534_c2_g10~~TRINITY_DN12534_c2_g10_i1.p2  ORF type:complete len:175 (+),score=12.60 TRINITY_DN12534_c2_g10_i1:1440-1964(+)